MPSLSLSLSLACAQIMSLNPAVLQCGPSLDLFGTGEIRMIAQMRSMGNAMVPQQLRPPLVALVVGAIALVVASANGDSPELTAAVSVLRPVIAVALGSTFAVAAYGASQIGRKPVSR